MNKKSIFIALGIFILAGVILVNVALKNTSPVTVERTFNAPVEKVWMHWNDAGSIQRWWSPKDYTAPIIQNDTRVGGKFLFSMKAPDGKISYNAGTYTEVIDHQKIVSKMAFSDEAGNPVPASHYGLPGNWPDEVTITVIFKSDGDKTTVSIEETGIPLIMSVFAKMGWDQQFDKFAELL